MTNTPPPSAWFSQDFRNHGEIFCTTGRRPPPLPIPRAESGFRHVPSGCSSAEPVARPHYPFLEDPENKGQTNPERRAPPPILPPRPWCRLLVLFRVAAGPSYFPRSFCLRRGPPLRSWKGPLPMDITSHGPVNPSGRSKSGQLTWNRILLLTSSEKRPHSFFGDGGASKLHPTRTTPQNGKPPLPCWIQQLSRQCPLSKKPGPPREPLFAQFEDRSPERATNPPAFGADHPFLENGEDAHVRPSRYCDDVPRVAPALNVARIPGADRRRQTPPVPLSRRAEVSGVHAPRVFPLQDSRRGRIT